MRGRREASEGELLISPTVAVSSFISPVISGSRDVLEREVVSVVLSMSDMMCRCVSLSLREETVVETKCNA
jgi:hypothetical protein